MEQEVKRIKVESKAFRTVKLCDELSERFEKKYLHIRQNPRPQCGNICAERDGWTRRPIMSRVANAASRVWMTRTTITMDNGAAEGYDLGMFPRKACRRLHTDLLIYMRRHIDLYARICTAM